MNEAVGTSPEPLAREPERVFRVTGTVLRVGLLLLAGVAAALGQAALRCMLGDNAYNQPYVMHSEWVWPAVWSFVVAGVLLIAACAWSREGIPVCQGPARWLETVLVVALFAAGLAVRGYKVDQLPDAFFVDEYNLFRDAILVLTGVIRSPAQVGWFDHFALFAFVQAGIIRMVDFFSAWLGHAGISLWTPKMTAALFGALTIPVFHLLLRNLFGAGLALFGTGLFAFSRWHIAASRYGEGDKMLLLLLSVLFFYAIVRALDLGARLRREPVVRAWYGPQTLWWALAGLVAGLAQYFWISGRVQPAVALTLLWWVAVRDSPAALPRVVLVVGFLTAVAAGAGYLTGWHPLLVAGVAGIGVIELSVGCLCVPTVRRHIAGLILFLLAFGTVVYPLARQVWADPVVVTSRLADLGIWSEIKQQQSYAPLWSNIGRYLLMYNYRTGGWPCANVPDEPALDFTVGTLFALGAGIVVLRCGNPFYMFCLIWGVAHLLGGILSLTSLAPVPHRVLETIPWCYLLATLSVAEVCSLSAQLWRAGVPQALRISVAILLATVVAVVGWGNVRDYFTRAVFHPAYNERFNTEWTVMARRCQALQDAYDIYLEHDDRYSATVRVACWPETSLFACLGMYQLPFPVRPRQGLALLLRPDDPSRDALIRTYYPDVQTEVQRYRTGRYLFTEHRIAPVSVDARRGLAFTGYIESATVPAHFAGIAERIELPPVNLPKESAFLPAQWAFRGFLSVPKAGSYRFQLACENGVASATLALGLVEHALLPSRELALVLPDGAVVVGATFSVSTARAPVALLWATPDTEALLPLPVEVLWRPGPRPGAGWIAEYFSGVQAEGPPRFAQAEPALRLRPLFPAPCVIRWRGLLRAVSEGEHEFWAGADDAVRVTINGQTVIDALQAENWVEQRQRIRLLAGDLPIEVAYVNRSGNGYLRVLWRPPSGPEMDLGGYGLCLLPPE